MARWDERDGGLLRPPVSPFAINQRIDAGPYRLIRAVRYLFVHRLSLSLLPDNPVADSLLTAQDVLREFSDVALGTGGETPYHAIVVAGGPIWQLLPLSVRGAHAGAYNPWSLSVAVIGMLDEHKMTPGQYASLIHVLASWRTMHPRAEIVGHTEQAPSAAYPGKRCPGRFVSMHSIRTQVACQPETDFSRWAA